jgi:hypothetical protein
LDPWVLEDFINCWSLGRIVVQDPGDEVLCLVGNGDSLRELIVVHSDFLVSSLNIVGLEWRFTDDQSVDDDSERPDIDLVRVTLLSLENLWSNIIWSTTDGSLSLSIELKFGGKTEITYLDFHLVVEEEITEFEISVNDSVGMKILYGVADLDDIALDLQLVESSPSSQKFVK